MATNTFRRGALLACVLWFSDVANLSGQRLNFYRGFRDAILPGVDRLQTATAGDTNGDGFIDVIGADWGEELTVVFGNGKGSFVSGPRSPAPPHTHKALLSADFNGDGKLDIIVNDRIVNGDAGTHFQPGDGTGRFGTPVKLNLGSPTAIAVAHINGDNKPDLFTIYGNGGNLVHMNNGDGTFTPGTHANVDIAQSMAIGDLNRDGRQDVVVAGRRWSGGYVFTILLATAAGELEVSATFSSGNVRRMKLGDFNRDGFLDIAKVTDDLEIHILTTFHGHGDGTFGAPLHQGLPFRAVELGVGDLNRDNADDIVLMSDDGRSLVRRANGDGTFTSVAGPPVRAGNSGSIVITDVNRDGNQDALVPNAEGIAASVLFGHGDGTLRQPPSIHLPAGTSGAARGDFNGDTLMDFAVANSTSGTVSVFLTNPAGGLTNTAASSAPGVFSIYSADFNGDQKLDLISIPSARNALRVLPGNGNGTFTALTAISIPALRLFPPAIGDFNGDSKPDVIVGSEANDSLIFFKGNGNGTFASPASFAPPGTRLRSYCAGEFTGDGKLDLAVVVDASLYILPGNGNGTFGTPSGAILKPTHAYEMIAADLNGDLRTDLIMSASGPGLDEGVRVLLGNGNGTFQQPRVYSRGFHYERGFAVGDVNGDGITDIYFVRYHGATGVLLGRGDGTFPVPRFFTSGRQPVLAVPIHYNTDNKPDLAVVNAASDITLLRNVTDLPTASEEADFRNWLDRP